MAETAARVSVSRNSLRSLSDTTSFAYDTLNRLCTKTYAATATPCGGTSSSYLVSYGYDLAGHPTAVNDNSAAMQAVAGSAQYVMNTRYDALNRPLDVTWSPAPAQTAPAASSVAFAHGYDATNRRIGQTATDTSWWSSPATASSTSYTANNLNQYTTVGSVSPTYDGNGNLTRDGTFTYCYETDELLGNCGSSPAGAHYGQAQISKDGLARWTERTHVTVEHGDLGSAVKLCVSC